jgi:hypothetical protein
LSAPSPTSSDAWLKESCKYRQPPDPPYRVAVFEGDVPADSRSLTTHDEAFTKAMAELRAVTARTPDQRLNDKQDL